MSKLLGAGEVEGRAFREAAARAAGPDRDAWTNDGLPGWNAREAGTRRIWVNALRLMS
jgi:hypothetical protein